MSTAETPVTPEVEVKPAKDKTEIYSRLAATMNAKVDARFEPVAKRVKEKHKDDIHMRRVFGDEDGRVMVVTVFNELLSLLTAPNADGQIVEGTTLGLPAGLGSWELLTAGATTKKTPQLQIIQVPRRWRIKWNTGKTVQEILEKLPPPPQEEKDPVTEEAPVEASA